MSPTNSESRAEDVRADANSKIVCTWKVTIFVALLVVTVVVLLSLGALEFGPQKYSNHELNDRIERLEIEIEKIKTDGRKLAEVISDLSEDV